jgi:hypothetical protein
MGLTTTPATTVPAPPVPAPGPVRQRRVRRGYVAAGVLAIVLAALGSASLFRAVLPDGEYLAVAAEVPAGRRVAATDLTVVRLAVPPGLSPVPAADAERVVGLYAAVPLVPGTLLVRDQLTDRPVPAPGEQLLAVPLAADRLPGDTHRPGAPVLLVATGDVARDGPPRTFPARVHDVRGVGRGGDRVVSVVVAERDGPVVAALAAADRLALLLVPEDGR